MNKEKVWKDLGYREVRPDTDKIVNFAKLVRDLQNTFMAMPEHSKKEFGLLLQECQTAFELLPENMDTDSASKYWQDKHTEWFKKYGEISTAAVFFFNFNTLVWCDDGHKYMEELGGGLSS